MSFRFAILRLSTIGALAGFLALTAAAADPKPAEAPCQKLTGADRTECERLVEKERQRPEASRPEPEQNEPPPPDTKSEGNDTSDTADPPRT
jgi:hypothetical protein